MKLSLTILLFFTCLIGQAQDFLSWQFSDRYFSLTVGTGSSTYFGELNYNNSINDKISQFNVGLEARLLSRIAARVEMNYFTLKGSDANAADSTFQRQRNLSFESRNLQFHLAAIYYIKPYQGDYFRRWVFDPYVVGGVGYMNYNPAARLGGDRLKLREALTEGVTYEKWTMTIPFGVGAKFRVNEFMNVNLEFLYNITFTDYLDDVSKNYATEFPNSTAELLSDRKDEIPLVSADLYDQITPGARRGDPSNKDSFMLISVKFEIFIPPDIFKRNDQPVLKKPSAY